MRQRIALFSILGLMVLSACTAYGKCEGPDVVLEEGLNKWDVEVTVPSDKALLDQKDVEWYLDANWQSFPLSEKDSGHCLSYKGERYRFIEKDRHIILNNMSPGDLEVSGPIR